VGQQVLSRDNLGKLDVSSILGFEAFIFYGVMFLKQFDIN
jgi:hypothetical protein